MSSTTTSTSPYHLAIRLDLYLQRDIQSLSNLEDPSLLLAKTAQVYSKMLETTDIFVQIMNSSDSINFNILYSVFSRAVLTLLEKVNTTLQLKLHTLTLGWNNKTNTKDNKGTIYRHTYCAFTSSVNTKNHIFIVPSQAQLVVDQDLNLTQDNNQLAQICLLVET